MNQTRIKRINGAIQKASYSKINEIVLSKFPGVIVSVTKVDTTDDLSFTKIYLSLYSVKEKVASADIVKYLKQNVQKVREVLAHEINLRVTPEVRFVIDETLDNAQKIESILAKIKKEESEK